MRVLIHCWATKILAYDDWMGTRHQSIHRSGASKYPIEWRHLTPGSWFYAHLWLFSISPFDMEYQCISYIPI